MEDVAARLQKLFEQRIPIESVAHKNAPEWLAKRQQSRKYGDLDKVTFIELQDAYLSDPSLPSFTGTVTSDTAKDVVRWAVNYELVRPENLTIAPAGQVLLANDPNSIGDSFSNYSPDKNPYLFRDRGSRFLWAIITLTSDALVLGHLLPRLPDEETFSRTVAGDLLGEVLVEVSAQIRDPKMLDIRNSLAKSAEAIGAQAGTSKRGLREHHIAIRVEPLVDVGLLAKPDPYRWEYRLDASLSDLADGLRMWAEDPAERQLPIAQLIPMLDPEAREIDAPSVLWPYLYEAHVLQRSPVGYAGIDETILTGICFALREGRWFRWETGMELFHDAQSSAPKEVRFNVDRYGEIRHIKLPRELPPSLATTN